MLSIGSFWVLGGPWSGLGAPTSSSLSSTPASLRVSDSGIIAHELGIDDEFFLSAHEDSKIPHRGLRIFKNAFCMYRRINLEPNIDTSTEAKEVVEKIVIGFATFLEVRPLFVQLRRN